MAFNISKKCNFDLKIGILKMLFKNYVCSTHGATLEIKCDLCPKMTNLKKIEYCLKNRHFKNVV